MPLSWVLESFAAPGEFVPERSCPGLEGFLLSWWLTSSLSCLEDTEEVEGRQPRALPGTALLTAHCGDPVVLTMALPRACFQAPGGPCDVLGLGWLSPSARVQDQIKGLCKFILAFPGSPFSSDTRTFRQT